MKKELLIFFIITSYLSANAFVVKVNDLPETVRKYPITLVSKLDNQLLDSVQPHGSRVLLQGSLENSELCMLYYSFDITGGVTTYHIPVFLSSSNDTVCVRLMEGYNRGTVEVDRWRTQL